MNFFDPSTEFTGQWEYTPVVNEFEGPSPRCGHTMTSHSKIVDSYSNSATNLGEGKLMVAFGESSLLANREYLDDIFILDLGTMEWAKVLGKNIKECHKPYLKNSFSPVARADHAAVSFGQNGDRCLIFGGKCRDTYLDDLIVLKNISTFPVSKEEQSRNEDHIQRHGRYRQPNSSKQLNTDNPLKIESIYLPSGPCGRRGSSLCPWKQGSFLLFGGQRGSLFFNDLWGLDLYKQGWVELSTRKNPLPRAFHSAFVDSQQQMLLLGGVRDTSANPASADIYKLDLKAGRFFKLGDKDMVPGITSALCKGHHSSHFLDRNCDLIIYSPQRSGTHILGGNVRSEHCGRCSPVKVHANTDPGNEMMDSHGHPTGCCRPATALVEAHRSLDEHRSIGCNNRVLEKLFVFGGYQPQQRECTNKLFALKFSSEACPIDEAHECVFGETPIKKSTERKAEANENARENTMTADVDGADSENIPEPHHSGPSHVDDLHYDKFSNLRSCNVTPMRASRRSRLGDLKNIGNTQHDAGTRDDGDYEVNKPSLNRALSTNGSRDERNCALNESMLVSPGFSSVSGKSKSSRPKMKKKRVSIVQTPVRARQCLTTDANTFSMKESEAANQKIVGLDPDLVAEQSPTPPQAGKRIRSRIRPASRGGMLSCDGRNGKKRRAIHSVFIEKLLLNFDESMLDTEHPFMLEPSQVIDLLHRALPLLEADSTLTRIEAPCKVFGDIHGQLGDLMSLFKRFGYPDANIGDIAFYKYVFLGDFVDRGHKCLEIMCLLLALKIKYPRRVFLIRGNHECHAMNEMYGFYHEINDRLHPNPDTLKYLEQNSVLVANDVFTEEMDTELNEFLGRTQERRSSRRNLSTMMVEEDLWDDSLDSQLEFEEVEVTDDDEDSDREDSISCELIFEDEEFTGTKRTGNRNRGKKTKTVKKYRSRRLFRDRNDCLKYLIQSFEMTFRWLPLAVLVSDRILCVHGGIGMIETLEDIESIERPCDVVCDMGMEMNEQQKKVVDLLWSDPAEKDTDIGFQPNKRGVSCVFGSDIVRNFCKRNSLDLIIRGHQVVKDGFEYFAGGHLITLFSATNYCNVMDNAGAILCIDDRLRVLPKLVEARPIHSGVSEDEEEEEEEESADNLQWRKLKQFPPSPMRGDGNGNETDNDINIGGGCESDKDGRDGGIQLQFDELHDESSADEQ